MQLFDALHLSTLLVIAALFFGLFFLFRKRSVRAKSIVLGVLMAANILQHIFKFWIWPHMRTGEFSLVESAYNVCAFMILLCPYSVFGKNGLIKQYQFYVGTIAGFCAPFVPTWFLGGSIFTWEYLRFYTCHVLLFLTSSLPAAWGMVEFRRKDGWKFGLCALCTLAIILANNALFFTLLGYEGEALVEQLYATNPVYMMGPPADDSLFRDIAAAVTPSFLRVGAGGRYIPILWYAVPVYLGFLPIGYGFGSLLQWLQTRKKTVEVRT